MRRITSRDDQIPTGNCARYHKRSRLDAIGNDSVFGPAKLLDSFDANSRCPCAFNFGAHFIEQCGKVSDFRFASAVFHHRFTLSETCSHQEIFSTGDGDFLKENVGALKALSPGFDVAVFLSDLCAHLLQSFNVEIDRTSADCASTGQGNACDAHARDQRPKHQRRCSHGLHQFVLGFRTAQIAAADAGAMVRASVSEFDFRTHRLQQFAFGLNVANVGNALQDKGLFGENRGCHGGQSRVFCATHAHGSNQRVAAANYKFIHFARVPD